MTLAKLAHGPAPVDRVAGRVVYGKGEHWEPSPGSEVRFEMAPPLREITAAMLSNPDFRDLRGVRNGLLTVLGLHEETAPRGQKGARWVCRCDCGGFVLRSTKAMQVAAPEEGHMCPHCKAKYKFRNRWKWSRA